MDRSKSRQVAGKQLTAEEGTGSAGMVLAREPGLVKMVLDLCGDWPEGDAGEGLIRLTWAGTVERRSKNG